MLIKKLWSLFGSKFVERKPSLTTSISIESSLSDVSTTTTTTSSSPKRSDFFSLSHFKKDFLEARSRKKQNNKKEEQFKYANEAICVCEEEEKCEILLINSIRDKCSVVKFNIYTGEAKFMNRATRTYLTILHAPRSFSFNKKNFAQNSTNNQFFNKVISFV